MRGRVSVISLSSFSLPFLLSELGQMRVELEWGGRLLLLLVHHFFFRCTDA